MGSASGSRHTPHPLVRTLTCLSIIIINFDAPLASAKRLLSLEDTVKPPFRLEGFNATWISDTELNFMVKSNGDIVALDVTTKNLTVIATAALLLQYNTTEYSLSADRKWIAIPHDKKSVFRHSTTAKYAVHELRSGFHYEVAGGKRISLLAWSPVGHSLVYVLDNDLYYQHKPGPLAGDRITQNGLPGVVYNGVCDWVYEEEVFSSTKALWFSPEGTKLAFVTFDDSNVHEITYPVYGKPGSISSQYVEEISVRYPKPGRINPTVTLNVIDLRLKRRLKIVNIPAPINDVSEDHILGKVQWVDEVNLAAAWTNRVQTVAVTMICEVGLPECTKVLETKEIAGWVNYPEFIFKNTSTFITILPQPQPGGAGNYRHVTLVNFNKHTPLSSGRRVVTKILKWDQKTSYIYYLATEEDNPARIQLYATMDNSSQPAKCLSCDLCGLTSAQFSKDMSYYVLNCNGPSIPSHTVYATNGTYMLTLTNNTKLAEQVNEVVVPSEYNLEVGVADGKTAKVRLFLPPSLDRTNPNKKYPLLLYIYGGPDSIKISDAFQVPNWEAFLTTRLEVVVAWVDGRGSARRGDDYKFTIYKKMGGPEVDDFISVASYLQKKLPYIDEKRGAIWGWSYGGYSTAMALAKDSKGVFKCGISVAPVTSWLYYDSIYTERYMGLPTPEDNEVGYNNSDVNRRVQNFRNKEFLLIHGNADDNVHYQQSMALSRSLEMNDIMFSQMSYPDEAHGLVHVRLHLYHTMEKFWAKCFGVKSVTP